MMVGHEKVIMVVAGALVFNKDNRILLQQRSDNGEWGIPGGFMELGEDIQETARREVCEETGLHLGVLDLFGIYSGPNYDKTFPNGDQVSMVQVFFTCKQYNGHLIQHNKESLNNKFFKLSELPSKIFMEHKMIFNDLLSKQELPIIK